MSDRRSQADINAARSEAALISDQLRGLFYHPSVQGWFESKDAMLIERMINLPTAADDARRSAALEIQALRSLRASVISTISAGERAAKKLMENDNG